QPLVGAQLELLPALLVDMRTAEHGPPLGLDGKRDWTRHLGAGLLGRADDVRRGLIQHHVVEGFESDSDLLRHRNLAMGYESWALFENLGDHARAHRPAA